MAALTYLQLCQRLARECDVVNPGTSEIPTTVANLQPGTELRRVVDWTATAYLRVLGTHKWSFLWERVNLTMVAGTQTIAPASNPLTEDRWEKESVYIPAPGVDQNGRFMDWLPWDQFRIVYPVPSSSDMSVFSIAPDGTFWVNAKPLTDTTIQVERYKLPTPLTADTDVPLIPEDLQLITVWKAKQLYEGFDEAGTQWNLAKELYSDLFNRLVDRCLPTMRFGAPLA